MRLDLLERRLEDWSKFQFCFDDSESRLLELTRKNILDNFDEKHEYYKECTRVLSLFRSVDIHPFDSGNEPEWEKWNEIKQEMVKFLQDIIKEYEHH